VNICARNRGGDIIQGQPNRLTGRIQHLQAIIYALAQSVPVGVTGFDDKLIGSIRLGLSDRLAHFTPQRKGIRHHQDIITQENVNFDRIVPREQIFRAYQVAQCGQQKDHNKIQIFAPGA